MKVGIIDLGSNTFNLLIAEIDDVGNYKRLYNSKVAVKLGEGGFEEKYITEEAFQRGIVALDNQIIAIKNFHCDHILAFATSAIRHATNGKEFVSRVKELFGVNIHIIDGEEEASMIYKGVQLANAIDEDGKPVLIMDIGGGSTEFIIADNEEVIWKESFELGVSRILEKFHPSDPITENQIKEIEAYISRQIQPLLQAIEETKVELLIGSSGSFDTLADIIAHRKGDQFDILNVNSLDFDMDSLNNLIEDLIRSNRSERENMPGMVAMRIDMIVLAAIFIKLILNLSNIKNVRLSRFALKEGILFDVLKGNY